MVAQEEVGTGLALGTAGEEEEVVVEVEEEEGGVVERGQAEGTPQGHHWEKGGRVAGWGTFPSAPASARRSTQAGSWELVQEGVVEEKEGEEMLRHWSVEPVEELAVEE